MMKIAVLGFEREGQSTLQFILRDPAFRGAEIWVLDKKEDIRVPKGVHAKLGKDYMSDLNGFDLIFRTPGVRYYAPEIQHARQQGAIISSATKLFFDRCPARIIGVTGTKGKGTTSTLIYRMLKAGGRKAFLAGNIGVPPLDILPKLEKKSWVVLELSSFQLIDLEKSPYIGVALMVTEEHLDWHADVKEYVAAKSNIVRFQSPADYAVIAEDYPRTRSYARKTRGKIFTFSRHHPVKKGTWAQDDAFWFSDGVHKQKICSVSELHIPGEHNWENASAAITAAKLAGIAKADIKKAIATFHGLEHRIEFVAKIKGVSYYNDSYSTTPDAAAVAMQAFAAPKILILGGSHKNADFSKLGRAISRSKSIKAIIGIGVEWPRIKEHIHNPRIQIIEGRTTMKAIIAAAHKTAAPGDVVIISPGCASFGMFKNYTDRGKQFKAAVKALKE